MSNDFDSAALQMVKSNDKYSLLKYSVNYAEDDILFPEYLKSEEKEGYWKAVNIKSDSISVLNPSYFKGKIFVLTGPGVQSYGTILASQFYKAGATVVGEETGGSYYSINAEKYADVKLGETDLILHLPLIKLILNTAIDPRIPQGRGLIPHYIIHRTIKSVMKDEDNQLDYCIQLITGNRFN